MGPFYTDPSLTETLDHLSAMPKRRAYPKIGAASLAMVTISVQGNSRAHKLVSGVIVI